MLGASWLNHSLLLQQHCLAQGALKEEGDVFSFHSAVFAAYLAHDFLIINTKLRKTFYLT